MRADMLFSQASAGCCSDKHVATVVRTTRSTSHVAGDIDRSAHTTSCRACSERVRFEKSELEHKSHMWPHLDEVNVLGVLGVAAQPRVAALLHPRWQRLVCCNVVHLDTVSLLQLDHHGCVASAVSAGLEIESAAAAEAQEGEASWRVLLEGNAVLLRLREWRSAVATAQCVSASLCITWSSTPPRSHAWRSDSVPCICVYCLA